MSAEPAVPWQSEKFSSEGSAFRTSASASRASSSNPASPVSFQAYRRDSAIPAEPWHHTDSKRGSRSRKSGQLPRTGSKQERSKRSASSAPQRNRSSLVARHNSS